MRENTTTDPTMLSARNFPREGEGVLRGKKKEYSAHANWLLGLNNSPNVLMSSLSIKSHNRSITSCTCFMHFPCSRKWSSPVVTTESFNSLFGFREQRSARGLTPSSQNPTVQGLPLRRNRKLPLFRMKGAQVPSFPLQQTLQECSVSAKRYIVSFMSMGKKTTLNIVFLPLQAQDRRFCVASQKGLHSPLWQRPLSTQVVLFSALEGGGQWLLSPNKEEEEMSVNYLFFIVWQRSMQWLGLTCRGCSPVQEDVPLQVALMASWHLVPAFLNLQFLQQGLFLSLRQRRHLWLAPWRLFMFTHHSDNVSIVVLCRI